MDNVWNVGLFKNYSFQTSPAIDISIAMEKNIEGIC